jgi:hypothetical protein
MRFQRLGVTPHVLVRRHRRTRLSPHLRGTHCCAGILLDVHKTTAAL